MKNILFFLLVSSSGCVWAAHFDVMTFNVENLFDTEDDEGKDDKAFLPLTKKGNKKHTSSCKKIRHKKWRSQCLRLDWSPHVLQAKMKHIAKIILAPNGGKGADIVLLQEVENITVLKELNDNFLKPAGYKTVILEEGSDYRGIDTALLSRFPILGKPILHKIPHSAKHNKSIGDTRPILQVNLSLPKDKTIAAFSNHFPAPFHPYPMREEAIKYLNLIATRVAKTADVLVAGGDFNVVAEEDSRIYRKFASSSWFVSHLVGCDQCLGSHYYPPKNSWSFLDSLLLFRKGKSRFEKASIRIVNHVPKQARDGKPTSFDWNRGQPIGGSDHFPVYARVLY